MWIRSQDRKSLLEIEDVEIDSINQVWGIDKLLGKYSMLGEYSTSEKALIVFNEIQDELDSEGFYITDLPDVYQMPQDDEVEV